MIHVYVCCNFMVSIPQHYMRRCWKSHILGSQRVRFGEVRRRSLSFGDSARFRWYGAQIALHAPHVLCDFGMPWCVFHDIGLSNRYVCACVHVKYHFQVNYIIHTHAQVNVSLQQMLCVHLKYTHNQYHRTYIWMCVCICGTHKHNRRIAQAQSICVEVWNKQRRLDRVLRLDLQLETPLTQAYAHKTHRQTLFNLVNKICIQHHHHLVRKIQF